MQDVALPRSVLLSNQLAPGNPFYNETLTLRFSVSARRGEPPSALNEIVRRHESLRTTFAVDDGTPVQAIAPAAAIALAVRRSVRAAIR